MQIRRVEFDLRLELEFDLYHYFPLNSANLILSQYKQMTGKVIRMSVSYKIFEHKFRQQEIWQRLRICWSFKWESTKTCLRLRLCLVISNICLREIFLSPNLILKK